MSGVLALDLGGTSLRAAWADSCSPAEFVALGKWPAPTTLANFRNQVIDICANARLQSDVQGLGVTIPGLVEGTRCRWVPNLPYLDGIDLAELLAVLALPVTVANDAQLSLLAEAELGGARDIDDAILLSIGTGIGSAVLTDGRIVRGARGHACSFGWACVDLDDFGDEKFGWLERQASGTAIDSAGRALTPPRDGVAVAIGARKGDVACRAAFNHVGGVLGAALAGAVSLLDPGRILLTGGVSNAADLLTPSLVEALLRQLPPGLRDICVVTGTFGQDAALIGAAIAGSRGADWWRVRGR